MLVVNIIVVQYLEKYKENIAIDMRKRGFSYLEIKNRLGIPKSTLAYWLRKIKLNDAQIRRLKDKRLDALRTSSKKRASRNSRLVEEIKTSSAQDIKKISQRELWLIGIVLYWRDRFSNGNASDLKRGVRFTSGDQYLIKLFLKWLKEIGQIKNEEIKFDLFINSKRNLDKIMKYWAKIIDYPDKFSPYVYIQKKPNKNEISTKTRKTKKSQFGLLRIRVKASSLLARQIAGWSEGIKESTGIIPKT